MSVNSLNSNNSFKTYLDSFKNIQNSFVNTIKTVCSAVKDVFNYLVNKLSSIYYYLFPMNKTIQKVDENQLKNDNKASKNIALKILKTCFWPVFLSFTTIVIVYEMNKIADNFFANLEYKQKTENKLKNAVQCINDVSVRDIKHYPTEVFKCHPEFIGNFLIKYTKNELLDITRKFFHLLALRVHPDKSNDINAGPAYIKLNNAFQNLNNKINSFIQ